MMTNRWAKWGTALALVAVIAVVATITWSADQEQADKAAVQKVLERFWHSFASADAEELVASLHTPALLIETDPEQEGGQVFVMDEKEQAKIKEEMQESDDFGLIRIDDCKIQMAGRSVAVAGYNLTVSTGVKAEDKQTYPLATLFHRGDKGWKIVASAIPQ